MPPVHNRRTVTTPGTPVSLWDHSLRPAIVFVQAMTTNTDFIALGGPGVSAQEFDHNSPLLSAGQIREYRGVDLLELFVDARVAGEGVVWSA